jgi:hypothetical protein
MYFHHPALVGGRAGGGEGQWKGEFFMGEGVLAGTRGKRMTKKETRRVGRGGRTKGVWEER